MIKNYVLANGTEINVCEMIKIKNYYEEQCTMEILVDNYDIPEDKAKMLASEARDYMDKYDCTETEAIEYILNNL